MDWSFGLARRNNQDPRPTQLISGEGGFQEEDLKNFINSVKLHERGLSYAVVAIMGPQSSGKSTLLNHLFRTNFKMMDALGGRNQETKGVWLAKALDMEPFTIVMDLEGTDGRERGEDNKDFEKQSALFALAVANIVLINMWCHDIGREQAANWPLLKTIFEIWEKVPKPQASENAPLDKFFKVEVTALPSFEEAPKQFGKQVSLLKQQISRLISPGELVGQGVDVPASGFSLNAKEIWKTIRENKDLLLNEDNDSN